MYGLVVPVVYVVIISWTLKLKPKLRIPKLVDNQVRYASRKRRAARVCTRDYMDIASIVCFLGSKSKLGHYCKIVGKPRFQTVCNM